MSLTLMETLATLLPAALELSLSAARTLSRELGLVLLESVAYELLRLFVRLLPNLSTR